MSSGLFSLSWFVEKNCQQALSEVRSNSSAQSWLLCQNKLTLQDAFSAVSLKHLSYSGIHRVFRVLCIKVSSSKDKDL